VIFSERWPRDVGAQSSDRGACQFSASATDDLLHFPKAMYVTQQRRHGAAHGASTHQPGNVDDHGPRAIQAAGGGTSMQFSSLWRLVRRRLANIVSALGS
jgi:hypothetical protein